LLNLKNNIFKGQAFALTSIIIILFIILIGGIALQPLICEDIDISNTMIINDLNICMSRLFIKVIVESSKYGESTVFINKLNKFQEFLNKTISKNYNLKFDWNGGIYFNWNSSISFTKAFLNMKISGKNFKVIKQYSYNFIVKILHSIWINSSLNVKIKASLNNKPIKVNVLAFLIKVNNTWIKVNSSYIMIDTGQIHVHYNVSIPPTFIYGIISDINGVIVKIKCEVKSA